jgi:transcriptional regulator GlxA family with amidase domain
VGGLSTETELRKAVAAQMLWRYLGEGERHALDAPPVHPAIEQAREFTHARLAEPITLDQLAAAAAVSPPHLVRLFRAHVGMTPMAYVWERRGVALLEQTGLSVKAIAEMCGFQTSYHFSRRVRLATGASPREVRRRAWR